jgi:acetoin utilization deacetylase AcuC-like enzyme
LSFCIYVDRSNDLHDPGPSHPERPGRIDAALSGLSDLELDLEYIPPSEAAASSDLEAVHDPRYLEMLERFCAGGGGAIDQDTRVSPGSFKVASRAAGAVSTAVKLVLEGGTSTRALCLVRPPGHHAGPSYAGGFCLINNVAVGARSAQGRGVERVAIVDFDVHHGNGTQEIFYEDSSVLYLSTHQYPWFPGPTGALELNGAGEAAGMNVNIPLNAFGSDDVYFSCVERLVVPIVNQFRPDLLLVSAGFDAHADDSLSLMEVTTDGFTEVTSQLCLLADELCGGRVVFVLEGGYNLKTMSECVRNMVSVMAGDAEGASSNGRASSHGERSSEEVDRLVAFHAKYWSLT